MKVTQLDLPGILVLELDRHSDERGWFMELWNPSRLSHPALPNMFVQDNIAFSHRGVLRGLHFQDPHGQGKLVTVTAGEIFDVAVDVRPASPTFGGWAAARVTTGRAIYIPEGFAHGYQVISDSAYVAYKCTDYFHPGCEHTLAFDDAELAIPWPISKPIVSAKDSQAASLAETRFALTRLVAPQ
ncbi:MAG: dTDP-4-dehydrorhamnose 3,5-epimerase [Gemmatimonadota bacterium]